MSAKFRNKYRIESARLQGYDYSQSGAYFVTICTKNRENFFGAIVDGKMILATMGQIADRFWREIPEHFPAAQLDASVIMPNHLHGIILLSSESSSVEKFRGSRQRNPSDACAETLHATSLQIQNPDASVATGHHHTSTALSKMSPKAGSLSTIIRSYKSACCREAKMLHSDLNFGWQTRFYDHIIRDADELSRIREYIIDNPMNWQKDELFSM